MKDDLVELFFLTNSCLRLFFVFTGKAYHYLVIIFETNHLVDVYDILCLNG